MRPTWPSTRAARSRRCPASPIAGTSRCRAYRSRSARDSSGPGSTTKGVLEWDTIGQRFLSCDLTGKTMYFLTPGANPASGGDAWVWTSATPAGGVTPAAAHANGVFGAFRYVQSLGGVIYMPTGSDPISFYKF